MARPLITVTVVLLWCAGAAVPTSATEEFGMDAFIRGPNKHAMHTALDTMIVGPLATLLTGLARAHGPDDWQARVHGLANADRDTVFLHTYVHDRQAYFPWRIPFFHHLPSAPDPSYPSSTLSPSLSPLAFHDTYPCNILQQRSTT